METLLDHVQLTVLLKSGEVLEVMIYLALLYKGSVGSQLDPYPVPVYQMGLSHVQVWGHSFWVGSSMPVSKTHPFVSEGLKKHSLPYCILHL